ncbi:site-specific integrase [Gynuella sp.]|uniref:site-specific integrase n=1 Tax=Gynuella sp. TaxID=2969146 RepID=UPI003D120DE8
MANIDRYLKAATRQNTRVTYQSAIRHFEEDWGGLLPATANNVAEYLAEYADKLAFSSLKTRVSALARWHQDQGFPDPTDSPLVKAVLKGIRAEHPHRPKQASPISIEQLQQLDEWFQQQLSCQRKNPSVYMQLLRNRALLYLGFWRAFRSEELCRIDVADIEFRHYGEMAIYLDRSKGDRRQIGKTYPVPALKALCPVAASRQWLDESGIVNGPMFRKIDRWGNLHAEAMHPNSLGKLIRKLFKSAGIAGFEVFTSHSLRRGFATWAASNGWDTKTLMAYVGWRDAQTALKYVESRDPFASMRALSGKSVTFDTTETLPE